MSYIGINIKKIRTVKKLTQEEFAELFNLKRSAVGSYEEGRAEPKIDKIIEIAEYFNLTVDQLVKKKLTVNEISNFNPSKFFYRQPVEVPFIPLAKLSSYVKNIDNPEKIDSLPKICLPEDFFDIQIAFEISPGNDFNANIALCSKKEYHSNYLFLAVFKNFVGIFENKQENAIENWFVNALIFRDLKTLSLDKKISDIQNKIQILYEKTFAKTNKTEITKKLSEKKL